MNCLKTEISQSRFLHVPVSRIDSGPICRLWFHESPQKSKTRKPFLQKKKKKQNCYTRRISGCQVAPVLEESSWSVGYQRRHPFSGQLSLSRSQLIVNFFVCPSPQLPTTPTLDDFRLLSRHLRTDSSNNIVIMDEDGTPVEIRRPRARSLRCVSVGVACLGVCHMHAHAYMYAEILHGSITIVPCVTIGRQMPGGVIQCMHMLSFIQSEGYIWPLDRK